MPSSSSPVQDRDAVGAMLAGADGGIDVIVPRGGRSLVERVEREARVPVFAHLEGPCHVFCALCRRLRHGRGGDRQRQDATGRASAVPPETLLVDAAVAHTHLPAIAAALEARGCALRGDARARAIHRMDEATEEDFSTEYLAPILSVAVVDGLDGALDHIARHSSSHTESIITEDADAAERFLAEVDSAIVMHNASTQFRRRWREFGMGAEIGIATGTGSMRAGPSV